ncbi:TrwC relaxase [Streptomyces sp. ACT-1]|nr:TrwC relaxase [Streptomyces sp. ACT-1]
MTVKGITAGQERYYRRNIALGDGAQGTEPTVSSSVPGVPPGVWHGQAAAALGLSGLVADAQMRALFGLGMHPDAQAIAARELSEGASLKRAMKAAKLGPALPQLAESSPLDKEIEQVLEHVTEHLCRPLTKAETKDLRMRTAARAFEAEYHRAPADGAELARYLAARSGPQRRAVTGYDLTFSNEELSLLFALGGPKVRRVVLEILAQARTEALTWIEHKALAVRTGPGGVAQQRAEPGLLATVYLHYESRAGDPMLHEHAVISPRPQRLPGHHPARDQPAPPRPPTRGRHHGLPADRLADLHQLYDPERLAANKVPVAAAVYHDDMYVDTADALRTAAAIRGLRTWVTDEYEHNGVRAGGPRVLDRLLALVRDEI